MKTYTVFISGRDEAVVFKADAVSMENVETERFSGDFVVFSVGSSSEEVAKFPLNYFCGYLVS